MSHFNKAEQDDWMTVYLKYLLFVFNFFFWVGGAAVMAVGIWTLIDKSDYLNILASSTFAVSAYILIFAGGLVMITGFLGFCAIIREQRSCLSAYFSMLLLIFLIELVAGVLAYVYYQRLSEELKRHLTQTLTENYALPGKTHITHSVDRLQQDGGCITKLEQFLADHLLIMGAVGIGIACLQKEAKGWILGSQLLGAGLTAYFVYILYKEEEEDAYSVM
ncbi:tetraspanin-11 isoform X15 [Pelodiscus sinensis]|uniref:tetraspanin-11 isoform X15 n=1 Tax=Pelodiscus sinensis TaxID=13735 RepID=UPI003F6A94FC